MKPRRPPPPLFPDGSDPRGSDSRLRAEPRTSESRLRAQPRAPSESGNYPRPFAMVRQILRRYLSPIIVDSVLEKAMQERKLSAAMMGPDALGEITSDIMIGLRLFVPEERLPQLMLELAEILEGVDP